MASTLTELGTGQRNERIRDGRTMDESTRTDLTLHLVRHGYSQWQAGEADLRTTGDHRIALAPKGWDDARRVGKALGAELLRSALIYTSPYQRTRETLQGVLEGAGIDRTQAESELCCLEDPRLREVEHGYRGVEEQEKGKEIHGRFFYRYDGGESPADCYDRVSAFIESMWRQLVRKKHARRYKKVVIVTHGLTIRCFVMRFLHLKVEDFERMENPDNCMPITIRRPERGKQYEFAGCGWVADGLEVRSPAP